MRGKKILVVDIDGTIANCEHRIHFINNSNPDWDKFFLECDKDKPIIQNIELVRSLLISYRVIFCTGRSEVCREKTVQWLEENGFNKDTYEQLLMRKFSDFRHDVYIKPELLEPFRDKVSIILEDRDSMVKKWRELGYTCYQVAEGNF